MRVTDSIPVRASYVFDSWDLFQVDREVRVDVARIFPATGIRQDDASPAAGSADHRGVAVQSKPVENHVRLSSRAGRDRSKTWLTE